MPKPPPDLTTALNRAADGDRTAQEQVYPFLYEELRKIAAAARRRLPAGETLGVTALVNEAYLKLADGEPEGWKARFHFFFAASRAMRDILVDHARRRSAAKRGGGAEHLDADELEIAVDESVDVLELNAALEKLAERDPDGHQIAMLRYFAGLTVPEVADTLETSPSSIERKWRFLRKWFARELHADP